MPEQLKMYMQEENLASCTFPEIPEGFSLHPLRQGEEEKYSGLLAGAGFKKWDREEVEKARRKCLENGIFILEEISTGRFAACAYCNKGPVPGEDGGGILGMVAVDPAFRGRHFAMIVCMAVMNKFKESSYKRICLYTDETRLPALKTYLKLGWKPVITEENRSVWQYVEKALNYPVFENF